MLAFLILALIGLSDASYLTLRHFSVVSGKCLVGQGCDRVLASAYSVFAGVPVAAFGVAYYLVIAAFTLAALFTKHPRWMLAAGALSVAGIMASAWFVYLQLFVLHAICVYCMTSAGTSTLLFAGGIFVAKQYLKSENRT